MTQKSRRICRVACRPAAGIILLVLAANMARSEAPLPPPGPIDYIIISHSAFTGMALDSLIGLKVSQGYACQNFTIGDGVYSDSIRLIIQHLYDATDYAPLYVLLVGTARRDSSLYDTAHNDAIANAAERNFIPAPLLIDAFDHVTCYDQWYTWVGTWDFVNRKPGIMIGRIPVKSTTELQEYVNKLTAYAAHGPDAAWKRRVLLLAGDLYRGAFPDYPSEVMVNDQINELDTCLPSGMTGSIIRYSNYASGTARKTAFVNAINSGQGLVALLATGASIDNLGYIVDRFSFDAGTDLSNSGMYPVMLALSCNLGQFDKDVDPTHNTIAENLILAPSRGVIGLIGPAGFSSELSNGPFIAEAFKRLFNRGVTQLGNLSVAAELALRESGKGHPDTYAQMSVLGDPGLDIDLGTVTDHQVDFQNGMEMTDPVPYQNRIYSGGLGLDSTKAGVVKKGQLEGRRAYRIEGYDKAVLVPSTYWLLNDDLGIVLSAASRFLTYRIKAEQHPEGVGRFGVNCVVDGAPLSGSGIKDQYGTRIAPIYRIAPLGQEMLYAFDLQSQYGKTVSKVLAGYDAASDTSTGYFKATIDDIRLTATWGLPMEVGSVQMPSIVYTNQTADVSVSATDPDTFMRGDSLSVEWFVTHGYVAGTGFNVIYYAPSYVVYSVEMKARVYDKGGHVDSSMKTFNVVNYILPPSCPHLSVWDGRRFVDEGAVLTPSRIDSGKAAVVDAIPFRTKPDRPGRLLRFALREDGNDVTDLERVTLSLVTLDSTNTAPLGVAPDGRVLRGVDSIQPYQCMDEEEFNHVDKVRAPDGNVYRAYGPGSVTLWYDFPGHTNTLSTGLATGGGAGLMMAALPKEPNKIVATPKGLGTPNIVTVSAWVRDSGWVEVARLAPRSKATLLQLVDIGRYGDPTNGLSIKIEWTSSFSADDLSLYHFSRAGITETQPVLSQAAHVRLGDVSSLVRDEDGRQTTIEPGDEVALEFTLDRDQMYDLGVMTFWGKYRPATAPPGGGITGSSEEGSAVILRQNVPNPFNAATRIGVFLPSEGKVTLAVHNVLGQQVAILADGIFARGEHEFAWDGTDSRGHAVATGVYFYTLRCGSATVSKRMLVVK